MEITMRINTMSGTKPIKKVPLSEEPTMEIRIPGRGATGMVRIGSIIK